MAETALEPTAPLRSRAPKLIAKSLGHRNVSLTGRLPDMLHCDLWRTGFASPHRQKNTLLDFLPGNKELSWMP